MSRAERLIVHCSSTNLLANIKDVCQVRAAQAAKMIPGATDVTKTIKAALVGAGAFGIKHLDGIKNVDGVEVVSLVDREFEAAKNVVEKYGIAHVATDLADCLSRNEIDAVILCTPT